MSDRSYEDFADATGTAVVSVDGPSRGLQWIIPMFSNEVNPFRVGSTFVVRRNGRFVTSTSLGSGDTAYGPPALLMNPGDTLVGTFSGLTQGDQAIFTIFYSEVAASAVPTPDVVV